MGKTLLDKRGEIMLPMHYSSFLCLHFERIRDLQLGRYLVSKLIELLFVREFVSCLDATKSSEPPVIINIVSPGLSSSNLGRNRHPSLAFKIIRFFLQLTIMHTAEEGSRGLVLSACAGTGSNGEFMYNGENRELEKWIYTDMGKRAQKKVFEQTMKVLEARKPGIEKSVGL
jgi:retinol dehydrogenase 12